MARSLNQINLIGRLGRDPEMRYTPSGKAVATFSVATDYEWNGADGTKQKETTWHTIETWGPLAEVCNQYLRKGSKVFVQGRQLHQSYTDQAGAKRYFSKVNCSMMIMLGENGEHVVEAAGEEGEEEQINFAVGEQIPF